MSNYWRVSIKTMRRQLVLLKYNIDRYDDTVDLYKQSVTKPVIFADKLNISLDNIPVFHSFYINHYFGRKIILMDYKDYQIAKDIDYNCEKYVVLCDHKNQLLDNNHTFLLNNEDTNERLQQIIGQ